MDYSLLLKTQPKLVKLFNNGFKKNRLSQVYLLDGVKGTPKMQAAMYLANLLLCDTHDFCMKCVNCKRIEENVHTRIFIVSPNGTNNDNSQNISMSQSIKVEQIDALENEFNYSGLEKGPRVFIINEIEKATLSAGNKLLKFLEEMKEDCYGVLITNNLSGVLDTIKSRSQVVTLEKMNDEILKEAFLSKGIDDETSKVLCTLTNNIKEGLELLEDGNLVKIISLVKRVFKALFTKESTLLIMNDESKFLFALNRKDYHQMFIDLFITMANDYLVNYLLDKKNYIFENTFKELSNLGDLSKIYDNKKAYELVDILLECKKRLDYNVNIELLYMNMLIKCESLR